MPSMTKPSERRKLFSDQLPITTVAGAITAIEEICSNRRACRIYLDDLPWKITATKVVKGLSLAVGQRHQTTRLSKMIIEAEERLAMELALQMFSYRARSRQEMVAKLTRRLISLEAIEATVDKLSRAGYLDDQTFVSAFINDRVEISGHGRQRIRRDLLAIGIDIEMINTVLDDAYKAERERELALDLAKKRISRYDGLNQTVVRRRLTQVLLRKGFEPALTQFAVNEALAVAAGNPLCSLTVLDLSCNINSAK